MLYEFCSKFHTLFSNAKMLQCKNVENQSRSDKVTERLKVRTFLRQCNCENLVLHDTLICIHRGKHTYIKVH